MAEVAADHPKVLDDPASCISFEAFGDNALTLKMCAEPNDLGHDRSA
jgi:small-conductance mechanosensitive channel